VDQRPSGRQAVLRDELWNAYIYVRDNAVNRIDPEGLEDLGGEVESLEEAETTVEESTNSLKTLMEYRLPLLKQGG